MYSLKARIYEMKPVFILAYLSAMGFLSIYSVERYLGIPFEPFSCLSFMGIIFGIYTLNRFTDAAEDFTNDIGRLIFFERKKGFLLLAVSSLTLSIGFLLFVQKLNWMHLLLLTMGFGYSYRLVPWYARGTGFKLLRIKEMTFLKNLCVSFLWGASVFILPILYSGTTAFDGLTVGLLAAGLFISTFNNTRFDDILDEPGDRVAGIKTLPTTWGSRNSMAMLMGVDALWVSAAAGLYLARAIDGGHALFLAFLGLYPFLYIGLKLGGKTKTSWVDFLSESDLFFFAIGMLLLGAR